MKKIINLFAILLLGITAQAQFINYQGVARDNAGNILINQPIALRLSVLSGSAIGTAVYVETHASTTDAYGLFALQIGQGSVVTGVFNDIAWSSTSFFLKVEIDPTGGTNYGLAGTTQFGAVPYSLHAKTADNGFSGNYNDLTNQPVLFDGAFGSLTGKPTTLAGYGITDGMNTSHAANAITNGNITNWNTAFAWGNHAGLYRPITYVPTWDEVTGKPVFATVATSGSYNDLANLPVLFNGTWLSLTGKPTTLAGYGITDAMNTSHAANAITSGNITNWNTAFAWGNHAGLYRPIGYVPTWGEITANPFAFNAVTNNQLLKYNSGTSKWENWTPNYLTSFTETDPSWTAASPNYYTKTNLQTSGAAALHFNNLTNKPTTLLGYGITDAMNTSHAANAITNTNITNWNTAFAWGNHAGLYRPISYVPAWGEITANPFAFTAVANNQLLKYNATSGKWENWTPNYLTSFTETDPSWTAASPNYYTKTNLQTNGAAAMHFNNLTNKPTTLLGYGITDAMSTSHAANALTNTNITNWNTAFSWGNHAGLYRPISYVPAWGEITANPFAFSALANNQLLKYNTGTSKWENWTPNYLTSFTETDPSWTAASPNYYTKTNLQTNGAAALHFNNLTNKPTTLLGYGITDAMNTSHAANAITSTNITNWDAAFGWGNHATAGYLTSFTESDPIFISHPASGITGADIGNWTSAYSWGNHATAGYLTSFTESDPIFISHPASGITGEDIGNWTIAYSWGNHATAGYLTSFTETDPVFISHPASGITGADIGNWNMAYNWGNHATAGYLTSFTETDPIFGAWDKSSGIVIASSQVSDFETSVTNTPAVLANTAKNSYPTEDAAKLAGIAAGAEVNVNADWNATSGDAQLLNKPILATVATTGSYNDLDNKPTQWDSTWSSIKNKPTGTNPGDMLYWNGTQWLPVPVGTEGQVLRLNGGIPTWGSSVQFASIITTAISGIGATTAISGGNLSDGGAPVTARGVCWGTTAGPTIEGSKTTDGIGSGAFTSNITGLSMATTYHVRAYATNRKGTAYGDELSFTTAAWQCGTSAITVNHLASGGVAPVDKSVSYATVTNIPGETDKCWITKNLGATNQATSVSDATEEAAGWYWQFNKPQGYKHDGTTRTPASTWINNVSENSDWLPSNDPCTLELGSAWRLPTNTEWTNIDASGNWTSWNEPYASSLKLHAAGGLYTSDGSLYNRGSYGQCWSSTQGNVTQGWFQVFNSGYSHQGLDAKTYGYSVRCLTGTSNTMTTATVTTTPVTGITTTAASSGGNVENDGGSSVTARGVCWNTTANPTITDTKTTDGSGTGTFSSSITGLTESTTYHVRAYATNSSGTAYGDDVSFVTIPFICGSSTLTVNHIAGEVAPVDKTTTYGTVTNIPGEPTKCWITKNLGATNQATSVDDASEASAGWYWQFNRKQGYKHDGTTRTPATAWIGSLPESSDWVAANDPCTIELGSGWRVPTIAEWTNVDASGGWTTWYGPFDSGLKIHAAGFLSTAGSVNWRGIMGYYWSSSLYDVGNGSILHFTSGNSNNDYGAMTYGFPARCLSGTSNTMTTATVTTTAVTGITSNTASTGGNVESDGGSSVTARGVCWSTTANPTITDTKTNDGSGTGTFSSSITGLTASTTYHVRAYATNSAGTAYGNDVSFVTSPFTCGSTLTINHVAGEVAPVDKTTTYGTVTNIPGEPTKCWITKNLGATNQATSVDDASEASAGWYWQFNKKQGYKHDGTTCTPATTWINSISENSDWLASNDPCTIELGGGWRLPTILEWNNLTASGGWTGWDGPYSSGLKLHAAGWLTTDGLFLHRGSLGRYWSSTQNEEINGWSLYFHPSIIFPTFDNKAIGLSVRCLRD